MEVKKKSENGILWRKVWRENGELAEYSCENGKEKMMSNKNMRRTQI